MPGGDRVYWLVDPTHSIRGPLLRAYQRQRLAVAPKSDNEGRPSISPQGAQKLEDTARRRDRLAARP